MRSVGFERLVRGVPDRCRRVEQREDALRGCHGGLEDVELLGEVADGLEEASRVLEEGDEDAERHDSAAGPAAADVDDQRAGQRGQRLDHRVEQRVVEDRLDIGIAVIAIDRVETLERAALLSEQLHRRHTGQVLLQKRVDLRDQAAHLPIRLAHVLAEPLRRRQNARQDDERHQRQTPVHPEHRGDDAEEREHVAEHRHHTRREQVVERVDVGRHARHHAADRVFVVEREVELLQVAVDLDPDGAHDALPGHLHHHRLHVLEQKVQDQQPEEDRRDLLQADDVLVLDVVVDRRLRQPRLREFDQRTAHDGDKGDGHRDPMRPQILQQPPHQPRVVRLPDNVVLRAAHDAANSSSRRCCCSMRA